VAACPKTFFLLAGRKASGDTRREAARAAANATFNGGTVAACVRIA